MSMKSNPKMDARALDRIAELLDGEEWNMDTCDSIATIVRETFRRVREYDPDGELEEKEDNDAV